MSPELTPSDTEQQFLRDVVEKQGNPIEGGVYIINLTEGGEHVVVFGEDGTITSSEQVIGTFLKFLSGFSLFGKREGKDKPKEIPPFTGDTDTKVLKVFGEYGGARVSNALVRSGLGTFAELLALTTEKGWEEELLSRKNIGDSALAIIKARLGV